MKRINPLLSLFTLCVALFTLNLLFSCSPAWHVGSRDKLYNMKNWKQDSQERKEARKARAANEELAIKSIK